MSLLVLAGAFLLGCRTPGVPAAEGQAKSEEAKLLRLAQHLTRYRPNPVLKIGQPGAWDDGSLSCFTILKDGEKFYLWYGGNQKGKHTSIGLATSTDGIHWTRSKANPLFPGGMPYAVKVDNLFYLYYCGRGGLRLATSSDAEKWKQHGRPVLGGVLDPCVVVVDGKFHLYYCGRVGKAYRACMATSADGIRWTKVPKPVLPLGKKGSFDEFFHAGPCVLKVGDMYYMWFLGNGFSGAKHRAWRIGFATSADGFTWKKPKANPVLDVAPPGSWDDGSFMSLDVLLIEGRFHVWYAGIKKEDVPKEERNMTIQIGYAGSKRP